MTDEEPLKEPELHLWVGIRGAEHLAIKMVIQFNENEELEIGFSMKDERQICVLSPSQWKMLQTFLELGQ